MVGVDPDPFSMRELLWMLKGRRVDEWDKTAAICCTFAQVMGGKQARKITPKDFHPYLDKQNRSRRGVKLNRDQSHNRLQRMFGASNGQDFERGQSGH